MVVWSPDDGSVCCAGGLLLFSEFEIPAVGSVMWRNRRDRFIWWHNTVFAHPTVLPWSCSGNVQARPDLYHVLLSRCAFACRDAFLLSSLAFILLEILLAIQLFCVSPDSWRGVISVNEEFLWHDLSYNWRFAHLIPNSSQFIEPMGFTALLRQFNKVKINMCYVQIWYFVQQTQQKS